MKYAVIVDPFSTGKLLAHAFRSEGLQPVAVLTQPASAHYAGASFNANDFAAVLEAHCEFPGRWAEQVRRMEPLCVVPGCESGVEFADRLCAWLGLRGNDVGLASCRRDKLLMQQQLSRAGLASIGQRQVTNAAQALDWLASGARLPVVVKPLRSAGSDNVWLCRSARELEARVGQVLSSRTLLGEANASVLVQDHIPGVEYVVDAVSCNGVPFITNACRYVKEDATGAFLYREVHVLSPDAPELRPLLAYHGDMLDALGIRFGASHAEIMLQGDSPVLIECGARLHGGVTVPQLVQRCCGRSQVEALVVSHADPDRFLREYADPPVFRRHAAVFVLANKSAGRVAGVASLTEPGVLRCEATMHLNVRVGDTVQRTVDLYTSPAWIALVADDFASIAEDIATLRQLEAANRLVLIDAQAGP